MLRANCGAFIKGDASIRVRNVARTSASASRSAAHFAASAMYSSALCATHSRRPIACSRLSPARETLSAPQRVTTGTPIHREWQVVVMPLHG